MKVKHIISAVLALALPFALILGFDSLSYYLKMMATRTFHIIYMVLGMLAASLPLVLYVFWLSFIMRTENRKAKILLIFCTMAVALFLLINSLGFWVLPFPYIKAFITTTALICAFANLFAGVYMLFKLNKQNNE